MLHVYLQEYNADNLRQLTELCRNSFDWDWEARVHCETQELSKLLGQIDGLEGPALFILEDSKRDALDEAVTAIRKQNALHYLVLRLKAVEDALLARPAYYRCNGFLLPPIDPDAMQQLLNSIYTDYSKKNAPYGGFFSFKMRDIVYRLPYNKILFFESSQKKVIARTAAQEYEFYSSLDEISNSTPSFFMRIHRGFCVNLRFIDALSLNDKTVTMQDGSVLPFSRTFRQNLIDAVKLLQS